MTITYDAPKTRSPLDGIDARLADTNLAEHNLDLASFDRIVISSSAGKDSQAMLTAVVAATDAAGINRDRLVVVHADLGRVEWQGTGELAERQADAYGLRFIKVSRPQGDLLKQIEDRGMFPSSTARFCTSDQKRGQIAKVLTALTKEVKAELTEKRPVRILECLGFRAEESTARAKRTPLTTNDRATNTKRTVITWLPIHAWSTTDVWAAIKHSGIEHHNAYDLGMPRLSCVFCIFAPKAALIIAGRANPELLDEYVAVEDRIGHTFKSGSSIRSIRDAIEAGEDAGNADDWTM